MTIQVGRQRPESKFRVMTEEGPQSDHHDIFRARRSRCSLCPSPTTTCTVPTRHLPTFSFLNAYAIKARAKHTIADRFVNAPSS